MIKLLHVYSSSLLATLTLTKKFLNLPIRQYFPNTLYIELVNGKFSKNSTMNPVLFWYYNQKTITSITVLTYACLRHQNRVRWHRHIYCFFRPENGVYSKKRNSGNDQCTLPTDKVKKVTCPFNMS